MDCLESNPPLRVPSYVTLGKGLGFLICKMGKMMTIIVIITVIIIIMIIPPTS